MYRVHLGRLDLAINIFDRIMSDIKLLIPIQTYVLQLSRVSAISTSGHSAAILGLFEMFESSYFEVRISIQRTSTRALFLRTTDDYKYEA